MVNFFTIADIVLSSVKGSANYYHSFYQLSFHSGASFRGVGGGGRTCIEFMLFFEVAGWPHFRGPD